MKKIKYIILTISLIPVGVLAQSFSLNDFDVDSILTCDQTTIECQIERETIKSIIQNLITQILMAQLSGVESDGELDATEEASPASTALVYDSVPHIEPGRVKSFTFNNHGDVKRRDQELHPFFHDVFDLFEQGIPQEVREKFTRIVFKDKEDEEFDVWIEQTIEFYGDEDEDYTMEINLAQLSFSEEGYRKTLEKIMSRFAFAMVNNKTQLDFNAIRSNCKTVYILGIKSCAKEGSYYQQFDDEFWNKNFLEWIEEYDELVEDEDDEATRNLDIFYSEHQTDFLDRDAASGLDSDITLSIGRYVTAEHIPSTDTLIDQKVAFFDQFEEMKELRQVVQDFLNEKI